MKLIQQIKSIPGRAKVKIHKFLWICQHVRPEELNWMRIPNDIEEKAFQIATQESAEYVLTNMSGISGTISRRFILEYCTNLAKQGGLYLEFGVSRGFSINHIASFTESTVHGFDSFEGIPEDWGSCPKGAFSTQGKLPKVKSNVALHVGWFNDTLPDFLENHKENISFLHVDSDLYSSAKTILELLSDRIVPGTVIVFDEYFNYPGWKQNEYLAFQEFVKEHEVKYKYIAYCRRGYSVAVLIE